MRVLLEDLIKRGRKLVTLPRPAPPWHRACGATAVSNTLNMGTGGGAAQVSTKIIHDRPVSLDRQSACVGLPEGAGRRRGREYVDRRTVFWQAKEGRPSWFSPPRAIEGYKAWCGFQDEWVSTRYGRRILPRGAGRKNGRRTTIVRSHTRWNATLEWLVWAWIIPGLAERAQWPRRSTKWERCSEGRMHLVPGGHLLDCVREAVGRSNGRLTPLLRGIAGHE